MLDQPYYLARQSRAAPNLCSVRAHFTVNHQSNGGPVANVVFQSKIVKHAPEVSRGPSPRRPEDIS